jgi:rRNA-processing protein EBP2
MPAIYCPAKVWGPPPKEEGSARRLYKRKARASLSKKVLAGAIAKSKVLGFSLLFLPHYPPAQSTIMAKGATLKGAIEREKGVNHALDKQKKQQKAAAKKKQSKKETVVDVAAVEDAATGASESAKDFEAELAELAANAAEAVEKENGEGEGWETDEEDEEEMEGLTIGEMDDSSDSDSDAGSFDDNEAADEDDLALSDLESLASEDREDVVPHQRLTINNTAALQRAYKSFALPASLPFLHNQTITSAEPVVIEDVEDDLNRELSFYKQSLDAVKDARAKLKKEGVPFSRPTDYFAEMVKSEEQMGKVKAKLVDEAARKKASADARRQRDLKKFGKAVQVAKLQERDRTKRDTMDKINSLKRKRAGGADLNDKEDNFDVALEDAAVTEKKDRQDRKAKGAEARQQGKRQKKDEKYGFGGKKRHAKSNDAKSASDMSGFSAKRMKKSSGGPKRPGKSQRAKKF